MTENLRDELAIHHRRTNNQCTLVTDKNSFYKSRWKEGASIYIANRLPATQVASPSHFPEITRPSKTAAFR